MNNNLALKVASAACGLLATLALVLGGWAMKQSHDQAVALAAIQVKLDGLADALKTTREDHSDLDRLDDVTRYHGRLHVWTKDEVNVLRHAQDLQPVRWPERD